MFHTIFFTPLQYNYGKSKVFPIAALLHSPIMTVNCLCKYFHKTVFFSVIWSKHIGFN